MKKILPKTQKTLYEGRKVTLFFLKIKHKSITNFKLFTTFHKN